MNKILFASAATAALVAGGMASAQDSGTDITLFGNARLGLGYNIANNGGALGTESEFEDDVRAVSRVRFGVNMTGTTDSEITFGATIRADNASGGQGGSNGQSEGNVFVSGSFGTLTFGDTSAADEQNVGDLPGNFSLTGLGDFNETLYISNGGSFDFEGDDTGLDFAEDPNARPTVRYDFEILGFTASASTDRDLEDIAVGASYTFAFGGNSFTGGIGYNDFSGFLDEEAGSLFSGGEQYSAGLSGSLFVFDGGVIYTRTTGDGGSDFETLGVGLATTFEELGVAALGGSGIGAYYTRIIEATGSVADADGDEAFGLTGEYDLGGGASVNTGIARTYGDATVADFGIKMSF